jgi:malonyl CoA-acyl carrier protein transacylase
MYTRLLTGAVAKSNAEARKAYLAAKRRADAAYAGLSRGVLAKAYASEDGFDALVCCVEMVRYAGEFAGLRATRDEVLRLEGVTWRPGVKG